MSVTRRGVLGGLLAGAALPVWGEGLRPMPRPTANGTTIATAIKDANDLVAAAKLTGITGYIVADVKTGRVLEQVNADTPVPPASVAKTITSLFALEKLGGDHRFTTRVMAVGSIQGKRLTGDLVLAGGGDPTLDSDKLGDLVAALAQTGLREVTGRFLAYAGALPSFDRITEEQPIQVGYDPGLSGLSLNFNRVNFEWTKGGATVQMNARGERFVPAVKMARMALADRASPLFSYQKGAGVEDWSVARGGLGHAGSRWLPVRQVAPYVAEVFQTLCAAQGIALPNAQVVQVLPAGAKVLVQRQSDDLTSILRVMLRFSTNITAETVGLAASGAASLPASAQMMETWAQGRLGLQANFVDHSGLGSVSRVTAGGMMRALLAGDKQAGLRGILRNVGMRDEQGKAVTGDPTKVIGKSGTLNFVSGLVGFIEPVGGQDLCFAIFSADPARREAVPMAQREEPAGENAWVGRAHLLQARLIRRWAAMV
ncbi:MAG: D-alanyl-D-alanine carboxypeptidase/D-alanyl-D-alanine-endopeptidase [Paracoccaceae bacterium]